MAFLFAVFLLTTRATFDACFRAWTGGLGRDDGGGFSGAAFVEGGAGSAGNAPMSEPWLAAPIAGEPGARRYVPVTNRASATIFPASSLMVRFLSQSKNGCFVPEN